MIVLQCTELQFLSNNYLSTIFTARVTRYLQVIFHLSRSIAFLIKRSEIHVKNTEKPTFLILKDVSGHFTNRSLRIPHYLVEI